MWVVKCWVCEFGEWSVSREIECSCIEEAEEVFDIEDRQTIWDKVTMEEIYYGDY